MVVHYHVVSNMKHYETNAHANGAYVYLPPTKEEVYVFARVRLSACLSVCVQDYSKTHAWI